MQIRASQFLSLQFTILDKSNPGSSTSDFFFSNYPLINFESQGQRYNSSMIHQLPWISFSVDGRVESHYTTDHIRWLAWCAKYGFSTWLKNSVRWGKGHGFKALPKNSLEDANGNQRVGILHHFDPSIIRY
ncbi:hypothetical protein ACOSP7_019911 [Xanthoceras sorbifolium]